MALVWLMVAGLSADSVEAAGLRGYFRHPSVHDQTVVFTAEGDLWTVSLAGGRAARLTTHLAQDGEAFRRLGMGRVIGTRTWGGEIWLSINNRLVDRGYASAAQTGVYGPEREWLIEGHGVDPDVVVDNLPHATFRGGDAQLDAAVKHLLEKIKKDPRPVPRPPKYRKR